MEKKQLINTIIYESSKEEADVLYRGVDKSGYSHPLVLWLTTSIEYSREFAVFYNCQYGSSAVDAYEIPISVLDKLADEKIVQKYMISSCEFDDEFSLYDSEEIDIPRMIKSGFSGYYYYEDEYKCLNVCLFKQSPQYRIISYNSVDISKSVVKNNLDEEIK